MQRMGESVSRKSIHIAINLPSPPLLPKNINYTEIGSIAYKVTNVERRIVNDFPNNTESLKEFHSNGGRRKGGGGESS